MMGAKQCSVIRDTSAAASVGSRSLALLPRGFRVKNWKVSAPSSSACRPMAANPLEEDR